MKEPAGLRRVSCGVGAVCVTKGKAIIVAIIGALLLAAAVPRTAVEPVQSSLQAAVILRDRIEQGTGSAVFRTEQVQPARVYDALEAIYPYAFTLQAEQRPGGTVRLQVQVARPARQQQAQEYAQTLAAQYITDEMTDRQKLNVLHDALVRLCCYDSETAEAQPDSGADAPFSADGALLDHRAVCAGYGRAFVMLCEAVDLPVIYISSSQMNHGWNAIRLDGQTYYIDCTFDDPVPDQGEYVSDTFFLLTAEQLARTHRWDEAFYEQILDEWTVIER